MRPMPVINVTATTQVSVRVTPWPRWVTVRRGFARELSATYVYDPPFQKLATGAPCSYRWRTHLDDRVRSPAMATGTRVHALADAAYLAERMAEAVEPSRSELIERMPELVGFGELVGERP